MVRAFEQALVDRGEVRRQVPGQQVNQGFSGWRIGILDDQHEAGGLGGSVPPQEGR